MLLAIKTAKRVCINHHALLLFYPRTNKLFVFAALRFRAQFQSQILRGNIEIIKKSERD